MIYSQPSTSICTTISKFSKIGSVNLMPNAQILVLVTLDGVIQYIDTSTGKIKTDFDSILIYSRLHRSYFEIPNKDEEPDFCKIAISSDCQLLVTTRLRGLIQYYQLVNENGNFKYIFLEQSNYEKEIDSIAIKSINSTIKLAIGLKEELLLKSCSVTQFPEFCNSIDVNLYPDYIGNQAAPIFSEIVKLLFHPNNDQIIASLKLESLGSESTDSHFIVWSESQNKILKSRDIFPYQNNFDVSPCGQFLATGGDNGEVSHYDLPNLKLNQTFQGHKDTINIVKYHPIEAIFASGDDSGKIILWDLNGYQLQSFNAPGSIQSILFTPNGQKMISISTSKNLSDKDLMTTITIRT